MKGSTAVCIFCLALNVMSALAGENDPPDKTVTPSGWAWTNFGQIVKGKYGAGEGDAVIDHAWREQLGAGLRLDATIENRLRIRAAAQIESNLAYVSLATFNPDIRERRYSVYVDEGFAEYRVGNTEHPLLTLCAGYFQYKYNPEIRNLGEYLFRTGAFPGYILNFYDWPKSRLLGLKAGNAIGPFQQDLLLTNETDFPLPPTSDYSLTWIGSCRLAGALTIGGGAQYKDLLSVNTTNTTPNDTANNQYFPSGTAYSPSDTSAASPRKFYSHRGIKLMGRFCFDPKPLLPINSFGKEDMKVYAEAAYLGLDDYTVYYDSSWHSIPWKERIPVTIGLNFPAFRLLDVLAVEWEWYGSRLPMETDIKSLIYSGRPAGSIPRNGTYIPGDWTADDIKWSIYAKRQFMKSASIIAQVARDHYLLYSYGMKAYYQVITKQDHWHWDVKLLFEI